VTGNDVTWPQVIGSDQEMTLFDQKSPGSGCASPKTRVYRTFHFPQGCSSQEIFVTWQERHHVSSGDRKWPGSDVIWPKSPGSGCRKPKTRTDCTFHFLQGCSSQEEAVTWQEMTSRDLRCPEVTRKWRHLTGSHQELAVEGQKLPYALHLTSYKALARERRHSRDRKWCHVTSGDWKWPRIDVIWPEVSWKWL